MVVIGIDRGRDELFGGRVKNSVHLPSKLECHVP
jgi:hypothetical protein